MSWVSGTDLWFLGFPSVYRPRKEGEPENGLRLSPVLLARSLEHTFLSCVTEGLWWTVSGRGGRYLWTQLVILRVGELRSSNMPSIITVTLESVIISVTY